ncbi:MAG: TetR/AcrR family transcriptional regulator [Akkermansiaceae bacterium]
MRLPKIPSSGPKKKLLDATELLVVEKGFDLVSVRDITGASKANVAAVNYHFGSREGLMDLIAYHVMEPLNAERRKSLEALKNPSVENLLDAYMKPLLITAKQIEMDLRFFLKLVGRVLVLPDTVIYPSLASDRIAVSDQYLEALTELLTKSRATDLQAAWKFFENGLGQSLIMMEDETDPSEAMAQWATFALQGLGGPKEKAAKSKKKDDQALLFDLQ